MELLKNGINKKRTIFHGVGNDTSQNQVTEKIYNGLGWLIEERVKVNQELKWESDFTGENKTYHEYDSLGRRTRVDHPDGTNVQIDYSYQIIKQNGIKYFILAKTITNEEGARSRHYLDPDGRALRSIRYQRDEDGVFEPYEVAEFEYDNLGNLTRITSLTDQIFNYKYNERGDILKIEYPDDTREEFIYDNVGNLIEKVSKNGEVVELKHDNLHRLIKMEYSTDKDADYLIDTDQDKIIYNYDEDVVNGLGNQTSIIDDGDKVEYSYDKFNRVNKVSRTLEEAGETWTSEYDYNSQGLLESIVYPSERVVNYDYDLRGLRTGIELEYEGGNKEIASYRYNENGAVEEIIYGNEVIQSEFGYDSRQRLEFIEATNDEELLFSKDYEYDRIGNRSKTVGTFGEEPGYLYDDLDRLTEVDYPGNKKSYFEYDPIGNRKELIYRHDTSSENQYHYEYDYNQDNNQLLNYQLSPYSYYEYDYNDNGSVLSKELIRGNEVIEETSYKYDLRNQLREIEISNKLTGASNQVNFAYNNKGWRVMKDTGLEKTYYLYGKGQQVLEERNEADDIQLFIYGNQGRLAVLDEDNQLRYVVNDILGSTSVVTDEEGSELVRYKYAPFGNLIRSEGEINDSYRFTGKEFDGTTGLYYYGARFYDPELGRFITEDPAQDGWNWFVYTANNPLKYVDPDGLAYLLRSGDFYSYRADTRTDRLVRAAYGFIPAGGFLYDGLNSLLGAYDLNQSSLQKLSTNSMDLGIDIIGSEQFRSFFSQSSYLTNLSIISNVAGSGLTFYSFYKESITDTKEVELAIQRFGLVRGYNKEKLIALTPLVETQMQHLLDTGQVRIDVDYWDSFKGWSYNRNALNELRQFIDEFKLEWEENY
ncbi:RHS repeat domain-containing protein [Natroniella sp. ANB-PHB2]|uniref:RHS repeat domain-containing protein n=1 Tax=Natroniella sp. ANB-PHB2 TaxID=3384444 RepID=UPI0038D42C0B